MDDQTEPSWVSPTDPRQLGTGILLVPSRNPERRGLYDAIDFTDISYSRCQETAERHGAFAMKWIPHTVAPYNDLAQSVCGGPCTSRCVRGCICDRSIGRCRKAD